MTQRDFINWLRGFAQAANNFNLTPKQWDDVKEMLAKVEDEEEKIVGTRYNLESEVTDHTGGPAKITYETKNEKRLLKTEPNY